MVLSCFLTNLNITYANEKNITNSNSSQISYSSQYDHNDLLRLEEGIFDFLNFNIKNESDDLDVIISDFYDSQNQEDLDKLMNSVKSNKEGSGRHYTLINGKDITFYDNGTFSISNENNIENNIEKEVSNLMRATSTAKSWDTGRYTVSNTRYGWFGLKLYTIHTQGRFVYNGSKKTLTAYVYNGDITKHFAGGIFNVTNKRIQKYVEKVDSTSLRGEFATRCDIGLNVKIKDNTYGTNNVVRHYGYAIVNKNTGYRAVGNSLEVK